ncbi:MAG TPA: permease, partial [Oligoflexia bacterium]|nr:permease [Oligoflexia bacterium]
ALGGRGIGGAIRGALLGMPLPLCSCSVMPTAIALRRRGASVSSTTSFTIATPETSIDALAVTAALLPGAYLVVRPLGALVLSVFVGVVSEWFSHNAKTEFQNSVREFAAGMESDDLTDVCRVCGLQGRLAESPHRHNVGTQIKAVFSYAYGTFFKDIAPWLFGGLVVAALIQAFFPADLFASHWLQENPWAQVIGAVLVGIPLYSCATATTPLVAVLLLKGLSPGAAIAFLLSAPATNIANVLLLKREFGGRIVFAYYAALFTFCIAFGIGFDQIWNWASQNWANPLWQEPMLAQVFSPERNAHSFSLVGTISSVLLLALFAKVLLLATLRKDSTDHHHGPSQAESDCCDH